MTVAPDEPAAVGETRVVHDAQRRATAMLVDALSNPAADRDAVAEFREFLVGALKHHHQLEDHGLWPALTATEPELARPLAVLTADHSRLDAALDDLSAVPIGYPDGRARGAAALVRALVQVHLANEEPVLLPALAVHVSDAQWDAFSKHAVESGPGIGGHLLVALLYEAAEPEDVALVLRHLPSEAANAVPAMRDQGAAAFAVLRGDRSAVR